MKLSRIDFVVAVCVPLGKSNGGGTGRADVRDLTFSVDDGWTIEELAPESVALSREGAYVRVEGVGYSCVPMAEEPPVEAPPPAAKGKKR